MIQSQQIPEEKSEQKSVKLKTHKIIKKIKEAKGCFFKEMQKFDKFLARLRKKRTQSTKIRNERGDIVTDPTEIKNNNKVIL